MKKRSNYKPRKVIADTMNWLKSGFSLVKTHDEFTVLSLKNHNALESLRLGKATKDDMELLVNMANMVEALAQVNKSFCAEYGMLITNGQQSLLEVCRRGRYVCKASELADITDLLELHDAQLEIATIKEIEDAMKIIGSAMIKKQVEVI